MRLLSIFSAFLLSSALTDVHAIVPHGEGSDTPKHPLMRRLAQTNEFQSLNFRTQAQIIMDAPEAVKKSDTLDLADHFLYWAVALAPREPLTEDAKKAGGTEGLHKKNQALSEDLERLGNLYHQRSEAIRKEPYNGPKKMHKDYETWKNAWVSHKAKGEWLLEESIRFGTDLKDRYEDIAIKRNLGGIRSHHYNENDAFEKNYPPKIDHILKVLSNRFVKKIMPRDSQEKLAQRLTCIFDGGLYSENFAQREILGIWNELKIYEAFLPSADAEDSLFPAYEQAQNQKITPGDTVAFVGNLAVFKPKNRKTGLLQPDPSRDIRDTDREFAAVQLAQEAGLSHVVPAIGRLSPHKHGSIRYNQISLDGNIESMVSLVNDAQKNLIISFLRTGKTTGSDVLDAVGRAVKAKAQNNPAKYPETLQNLMALDLARAYADTQEGKFFQGNVSLQNVQDLFIFSLLTRQNDANTWNMMLQVSPALEVKLLLTDLEYSLTQQNQWNKINKAVVRNNLPLLNFDQAQYTLTDTSVQLMKNLDPARLRASLRHWYPQPAFMGMPDYEQMIQELGQRALLMKRSAQIWQNENKTLRQIWDEMGI